jgi:hypothetical protein
MARRGVGLERWKAVFGQYPFCATSGTFGAVASDREADKRRNLLRQLRRPFFCPYPERNENAIKFTSARCGVITLVRMLNQACFTQFFQARIQNRRRDRFATFLQLPESAGSAFAQVPQNSHGPASPQQVQERHDRDARSRASDGFPGFRSSAHEGIPLLLNG